jgi:hypothetical protein
LKILKSSDMIWYDLDSIQPTPQSRFSHLHKASTENTASWEKIALPGARPRADSEI